MSASAPADVDGMLQFMRALDNEHSDEYDLGSIAEQQRVLLASYVDVKNNENQNQLNSSGETNENDKKRKIHEISS
jgi:hypothetical protein